jgi:transcriptional regulator with XRE-family HTH domain
MGASPRAALKLENDVVKSPSPHVLHQLSEALTVPYASPDSQEENRRAVEKARRSCQLVGVARCDLELS